MTRWRSQSADSSSDEDNLEKDLLDQQDDVAWQDWVEEGDVSATCLLCSFQHHDLSSMASHLLATHQLSFVGTFGSLDFYDRIKLVNWIRQQILVLQRPSNEVVEQIASCSKESLLVELLEGKGEVYLKPVKEDDSFLFWMDDDFMNTDSQANPNDEKFLADPNTDPQEKNRPDLESSMTKTQLQDLQFKYQALLERFEALQTFVGKQFALDESMGDLQLSYKSSIDRVPNDTIFLKNQRHFENIYTTYKQQKEDDELDYYFSSYSNLDIHESMLKDCVRTEAYRDFFYENKHFFKDKVVLDVGCGTGILSLFAARAGARKVYAVDNTPILEYAKRMAQQNKIECIEFIRSDMDKVELEEQVDVIVSEWMGYGLLYEGMFDCVLRARQRFLKQGGTMMPSHASMHLAAIEDEDWMNERVDFWQDVYGFDMTAMQDFLYLDALVDLVDQKCVVSSTAELISFDAHKVEPEELDFITHVDLCMNRSAQVHGLCLWFDIDFQLHADVQSDYTSVHFSTSPKTTATHWRQTRFVFKKGPWAVEKDDRVKGTLRCHKRKQNKRELDFVLRLQHYDRDGQPTQAQLEQQYRLC